jgi:hypothetical protein
MRSRNAISSNRTSRGHPTRTMRARASGGRRPRSSTSLQRTTAAAARARARAAVAWQPAAAPPTAGGPRCVQSRGASPFQSRGASPFLPCAPPALPHPSLSLPCRGHKAPARPSSLSPALSRLPPASQAPWAVGWQMSERNLVWNDDLKLRLIRVGGHRQGARLLSCQRLGSPRELSATPAARSCTCPRRIRASPSRTLDARPRRRPPPRPARRV